MCVKDLVEGDCHIERVKENMKTTHTYRIQRKPLLVFYSNTFLKRFFKYSYRNDINVIVIVLESMHWLIIIEQKQWYPSKYHILYKCYYTLLNCDCRMLREHAKFIFVQLLHWHDFYFFVYKKQWVYEMYAGIVSKSALVIGKKDFGDKLVKYE